VLWNDALINLLEIPHRSYFIKQNFHLSQFLKDEGDAEYLRKILDERKGVYGEEFQIKTFTGKTVWVRLYGKTIEKNRAIYFDASIENITDKKNAQNVLQKAYQELQKTDHMKNEIISITSHELRTPLTIIKGFASILLNEIFGTLNDVQRKYTNKILKNTNSMLDLVSNMLDLEKLESGKMRSEFERVDLNDLIENAYSDFRIRCVLDHKELIFHRAKPDITLPTDPKHLSRILINLIDNAIKFTQPHDGKIEIFVKTPNVDTVEIHVKDNGVGISAEDQKDLFKKFAQIGERIKRVSGGSGLGLPISKKLAQQIGGDLCVTSTPGKGSDFYVILHRDNNS
jgi:signal transduction histidine kinase